MLVIRLAIIVSHPIQYYAPLYQRLARRDDLEIKVFFTWHAGQAAVPDPGFRASIAWDVPLTDGYNFELVPNFASAPGTHSFFGLRNPTLLGRVLSWKPDAVHITGWALLSHLFALRGFRRLRIPTIFRGDSHLLDLRTRGLRWWVKRMVLRRIFSWPKAFLYVGNANRAYYQAFGVGEDRLYRCPHSIDVARFAQPAGVYEKEADDWRLRLGISTEKPVLLFAGKFERKKRPLELMRTVQAMGHQDIVLLMVGSGELEPNVRAIAETDPKRFRVLPFQNQSRMPIVYRLGDVFVLPSAYGESWGLAVNEAMACGRPVIVSDRVGCAQDLVDDTCGRVFPATDLSASQTAMKEVISDRKVQVAMGHAAGQRAWAFDIAATESALMVCLRDALSPSA